MYMYICYKQESIYARSFVCFMGYCPFDQLFVSFARKLLVVSKVVLRLQTQALL